METEVLKVNPVTPDTDSIAQAARLIRDGELVAFPTETVYGLGADATNPTAVRKIFVAKGRPSDNPLIVHIAKPADIYKLAATVPPVAQTLIEHFWPGPLSLVLSKSEAIPDITTAGLTTVVVRCPAHPVARALIAAAGVPIAAPSANRSGYVSPTTAAHVMADLGGRIPLVLDGGRATEGLESTVVDCTTTSPTILRPGSITAEQLTAVIGDVQSAGVHATERSPGMKYRHYATTAPLRLFTSERELIATLAAPERPQPLGVISHTSLSLPDNVHLIALGSDPVIAAPRLYDALRTLDTHAPAAIWIVGYPETGIGAALMNRIKKAALGAKTK